MSKKLMSIVIVAYFAVLIPACSAADNEEASPDTAQTSAFDLPNMLVEAEGQVLLRRSGWNEFVLVGFGVQVSPGDLLRVEPGSQAAVFCGQEALWDSGPTVIEADALEHGIPCQSGRPPRPWADVASLRDENDVEEVYAVRPVDSALLETKPNLKWNVISQQNSSDGIWLSVVGDDGKERSPIEMTGLGTEWPDAWPELEYGATYVLRVGPDEVSISTEGASIAGVGFWLLDPEEAKVVRTQEANLRSQPLSAEAKDLLVADMFLSRGMKAEAMELLESIDTRDNTPRVGLLLGQIYLDLGLLGEAEVAFSRSFEYAVLNGELEAEAELHIGLGMIASARDNLTLAKEHYDAAKQLYGSIGSDQGIQQVEELMNE